MTWMQDGEQKWYACHQDDKLWGVGIMTMIPKTMKGVPQSQKGREKERQLTARRDGGGLEVSQHADTMREEEPQKHQQLQQQSKPKILLKMQPKPQPAPKPKSASTPAG